MIFMYIIDASLPLDESICSPRGLVYISGGNSRDMAISVMDLAGNFYGVLGSPGNNNVTQEEASALL